MVKGKTHPLGEVASTSIASTFKGITKDPERFLKKLQPDKCEAIRKLIKDAYKTCVSRDISNADSRFILQDLIVDEMDEEQIWQQLEIRNDTVLKQFVDESSKLLSLQEAKLEIRLDESDDESEQEIESDGMSGEESETFDCLQEDEEEEGENEEGSEDDSEEEREEQNAGIGKQKFKNKYRSIVDDRFFKLSEMEAFLEAEDNKEMLKHKGKKLADDGIDYFDEALGGDEDDESDENPNYSEFFDDADEDTAEPRKRKDRRQKDHFGEEKDEEIEDDEEDEDESIAEEHSDEDGEENEGEEGKVAPEIGMDGNTDTDDSDEEEMKRDDQQSSFQQQEARMKQRIRQYENEVLGEKPWQLKGEIQAGNRPQNSLLEEILEFDSTMRPAPIITEETTRCLEDIIKQRIKDKAWDDVERTVKPTHTPQDYRKQLVLDQEKSKESLAQIYEKEYQNQIDPGRYEDAGEQMPPEHKEIKSMMTDIFASLDALFNYNFTPKPVMPEPKILTNTPAVNMEEVAPVAVSDATLLAPEEVYRGPKHGLVGKTERNRTDKNRERRKKKQKQRAIHKVLEERDLQRQKLGIPLSKKQESAKLMKSIVKHRNVEKMVMSNDAGSLKSSKAFFSKLQDTTANADKTTNKKIKRQADGQKVSAKKLKL